MLPAFMIISCIQSMYNFFFNLEADQESRESLIAIMAGSISGVLILILLLLCVVSLLLSVVTYLKCRQKAFNLTSNVA